MTTPFDVTDDTFKTEVLEAAQPTLVDFWAEWCAPCKMIAPSVDEIAAEYKDRIRIAKMDIDSSPKTPGGLGIMGIPTLILFKDGAEVERLVGFRTKEAMIKALLPHI